MDLRDRIAQALADYDYPEGYENLQPCLWDEYLGTADAVIEALGLTPWDRQEGPNGPMRRYLTVWLDEETR